jgi:predicted RNA-binding Zn-ribbon protein involved in translation (DUF1610 family)
MHNPKPKGGFSIGVTCPGCGGTLQLEENFFVIECRHCGSVLRVKIPDIPPAYLVKSTKELREIRFTADRHLKKHGLPLTESGVEIRAVYYPYWKIDLIMLRVRNRAIERVVFTDDTGETDDIKYEERKTEINLSPYSIALLANPEESNLPESLGKRTEYISLVPYSRANYQEDFDCRSITLPLDKAIENVQNGTAGFDNIDPAAFGRNRTKLFHPVCSVVYFPYYIIESVASDKTRLLISDGISGRIVHFDNNYWPEESSDSSPGIDLEFGELAVDVHRCTTCGIDLPVQQSHLYICSNCHTIVSLSNHPRLQENIYITTGADKPNDRLIPFWSFKISDEQARLIQSMFGGIYRSDRLVIPGFRVSNFEAVYRLSKRMSAAMPKFDFLPAESFDNRFEPVSLSMEEAITTAEVLIYRARIARRHGDITDEVEFTPSEVSVIYAPFHAQSYFYVDSILNAVTFEKKLVE